MTDVGTAIRKARHEKGLTQRQLADAAGVDITTVGRLERGLTKDPASLDKLQRALGMGIYAPAPPVEPPTVDRRDPLLSEATFEETVGHLLRLHGEALRKTGSVTFGGSIDRLPPELNGDLPHGREAGT